MAPARVAHRCIRVCLHGEFGIVERLLVYLQLLNVFLILQLPWEKLSDVAVRAANAPEDFVIIRVDGH